MERFRKVGEKGGSGGVESGRRRETGGERDERVLYKNGYVDDKMGKFSASKWFSFSSSSLFFSLFLLFFFFISSLFLSFFLTNLLPSLSFFISFSQITERRHATALKSLETVLALLIGFTLTSFTVTFREEGDSRGKYYSISLF